MTELKKNDDKDQERNEFQEVCEYWGNFNYKSINNIRIGYVDFRRLCKVEDDRNWEPCIEIRYDGVWRVPPDKDLILFAEERNILSDHPKQDLSLPALSFPCSFKEFREFLKWLGGDVPDYVSIDSFEKFLQEKEVSPSPKRVNKDRDKVRAIASEMWKNDSSLTIEDVINSNEVNTATKPRVYNGKVLRRWVKDLAPNRKPGRRPNKPKSSV